jgi:biotin carboxylase
MWSRYAAARELGPDPLERPAAFAAAVGAVAERAGRLVVYPGHEESIDALFEADLPPSVIFPFPGAAVTQAFRDKRRLAELAGDAGLPVPRTLLEATAGELAGQAVGVPCAVKAARPGGSLGLTQLVDDADQLRELLPELPPDEPLVVQERADGPLIGLALVIGRDGHQIARFQQVARRTWPPEAGGSTLAVSTEVDEDLAERSTAMLAGTGYWGLAHLQFLRTSQGHTLIDVNTRYYGSMPLATAAGVNLPAAWHAVVTGTADGSPPPRYRVGMAYRWLEPELAAALLGSPGLLLARGPRARSGAMWASDDPVASALLALQAATTRVGRQLRRLRAGSA